MWTKHHEKEHFKFANESQAESATWTCLRRPSVEGKLSQVVAMRLWQWKQRGRPAGRMCAAYTTDGRVCVLGSTARRPRQSAASIFTVTREVQLQVDFPGHSATESRRIVRKSTSPLRQCNAGDSASRSSILLEIRMMRGKTCSVS